MQSEVDQLTAKSSAMGGRTRSRGFPVLDLKRAVEAVTSAGTYGLSHSRNAFAEYLGHRTADSGPFKQKLAALRDFGLVDSGHEIRLTDLGARLALPSDAEQELRDRQEAFFQSDTFADMFRNSAKGIQLDRTRIAATAVHNLGISPQNRDAFADFFIESAVFAGLATEAAGGGFALTSEQKPSAAARTSPIDDRAALKSVSSETGGILTTTRTAASISDAGGPVYQTDLVVRHDLGDGEVVFSLKMERPISAALFGQMSDVVQAMESLAAKAKLLPGVPSKLPDAVVEEEGNAEFD